MADTARPAGFWQRYTAWSLDAAIIAVPVWFLCAERVKLQAGSLLVALVKLSDRLAQELVDMLMQGGDPLVLAHRLADDVGVRGAIDGLAANVVALAIAPLAWFAALAAAYWIGFESSRWQATPGKRALGLRATGMAGEKLSWGRVALRHFAGAASWITLNLGHALAAWTPQKRALHDFMAGTRVIADDASPMPGWARIWIGLQAVALLTGSAWVYLTLLRAMRTSVDGVLN